VKNEFPYQPNIVKCIDKANERHAIKAANTPPSRTVTSNRVPVTMYYHDIIYIHTAPQANRKLEAFTFSRDKSVSFNSTIATEEKILDDRFFKCSKSCIVNLDHVREVKIVHKTYGLKDMTMKKICHHLVQLEDGHSVILAKARVTNFRKAVTKNSDKRREEKLQARLS